MIRWYLASLHMAGWPVDLVISRSCRYAHFTQTCEFCSFYFKWSIKMLRCRLFSEEIYTEFIRVLPTNSNTPANYLSLVYCCVPELLGFPEGCQTGYLLLCVGVFWVWAISQFCGQLIECSVEWYQRIVWFIVIGFTFQGLFGACVFWFWMA